MKIKKININQDIYTWDKNSCKYDEIYMKLNKLKIGDIIEVRLDTATKNLRAPLKKFIKINVKDYGVKSKRLDTSNLKWVIKKITKETL